MQKILVFLAFLFFTSSAWAQVEKGQVTLAAGMGLAPTYLADRAVTDFQPVSINLGYRFADNFSLNAYAGYSAATSQEQLLADGSRVQYQNELMVFGLRAEAHTDRFDRFDIYGGLQISYFMPSVTQINLGENAGEPQPLGPSKDAPYKYKAPQARLLPTGFVGGTWYVSRRFGIFAEVGYNVSLLTAGLQYRL